MDTNAYSQHGTADLTIRRKIGVQSDVFARGSYFDDSRNNGTIGQTNGIRLGEGAVGADLDLSSVGTLQLRSYGNFENYHQSFYLLFSVQITGQVRYGWAETEWKDGSYEALTVLS